MKRFALALVALAFCLLTGSSAEARGGGSWTSWARRPWIPTDVAQTVAWFSPRSKFTNTSGKASDWTDQGGTFTATQATAGNRPAVANGINGFPSFTYTGASSQELTNTTQNPVSSGTARYVLAVAKSAGSGVGTGGTLFCFRLNTTGGRKYALSVAALGDANTYYFTDAVSNNVVEATAGAPTFTSPYMIEWELAAGQAMVVRVNNVARTLSGGSLNATGELGTTGFHIGSQGSQFYDGDIADIYIASVVPSAGDKDRIRQFIARQNGLTIP